MSDQTPLRNPCIIPAQEETHMELSEDGRYLDIIQEPGFGTDTAAHVRLSLENAKRVALWIMDWVDVAREEEG